MLPKRRGRTGRRWVVAAVLALGLATADATTVVETSLEENVARSEYVVEGRMVDRANQWVRSGDQRVFVTAWTVEVGHTWIGERSVGEITVLIPGGGSPDGGETYVPVPSGFPEFEKDDEVLLMLERATETGHVLPALHQSYYEVVESTATDGRREVRFVRPGASAAVVDREGRPVREELFRDRIVSRDEMAERLEAAADAAGKTFRPLPIHEDDEANDESPDEEERE